MNESELRAAFAAFVDGLVENAVATELKGCTQQEIAALERAHDCKLPLAYRLFLETMGHSAGRLFSHDHMEVTYDDVLNHNRDSLESGKNDPAEPEAAEFSLPARSVVIASRLREQFLYIVCDDPLEVPVHYVNHWDYVSQQWHPSILEWLRAWEAEAVEVIADGYYE
ncbi:MAG: SMI1/KNR4 family protein [Polyangiaceae bacterium]